MSSETEKAMFGATLESLEEEFRDKDNYEKLFAAMSMISDSQEMLERLEVRGRQDKLRADLIRKRLNVAKWLMDGPKSALRKESDA